MMMLRANTTSILTVVELGDLRVPIEEGVTYDVTALDWAAVYREHPEAFDAPVEQATAAPGEKRSTRRAPAKRKK